MVLEPSALRGALRGADLRGGSLDVLLGGTHVRRAPESVVVRGSAHLSSPRSPHPATHRDLAAGDDAAESKGEDHAGRGFIAMSGAAASSKIGAGQTCAKRRAFVEFAGATWGSMEQSA